jgi:enoyl-CoA hydratase
MQTTLFQLTIEDGIATVTFDRPPVNAQNRTSREELTSIFDMLSDRDDVRVVILTGSGHVFSAGADIKERVGLVSEPGDYIRHNRLTREAFYAIRDCAKPVIAAVNGGAIGAGFAFVACCDIIICAEEAYAQMPEINVGLAGGARFLDMFSRTWARYIYLTGRKVSAQELYRLGVAQAVVPRDQLMPTAMEIAREIASKSPVAVQRNKAAFNTVESMPDRDGYRFEQSVTIELSKTEDAAEAQRAFVERRPAKFVGR